MSLYLDANTLVPLVVDEPQHPDVGMFLEAYDPPFMTSALAQGECVSALGRYVRRRDMTPERADIHLRELDDRVPDLCVLRPIDDKIVSSAALLLRHYQLGLRMPDAIHLVLARDAGVPLLTLDARLLRAAEALGIDAMRPG